MFRALQLGVATATLGLAYLSLIDAGALGQGSSFTLAAANNSAISLGEAIAPWIPILIPIIGGIVIVILDFIRQWVKIRTGIVIEDARMRQLQSAITNAAGLVLTKLPQTAKDVTVNVGSPAVKQAVEYVNQSAADAVAKFELTPEQIAEKIIAKVGVITAANPDLVIKSDTPPPPRPGDGG